MFFHGNQIATVDRKPKIKMMNPQMRAERLPSTDRPAEVDAASMQTYSRSSVNAIKPSVARIRFVVVM
jgi:hypothetical protein